MPSTVKHLKRARAHLQVAEQMRLDPSLLSWAGVVVFYVARDLAHAVFDADPDLSAACRHPTSHTNQDLASPGTNSVIKRHFRSVSSPYLDLYSMSRGVRYEGQTLTVEQFAELFDELSEVARWTRGELDRCSRESPPWLVDLADPTTVAAFT